MLASKQKRAREEEAQVTQSSPCQKVREVNSTQLSDAEGPPKVLREVSINHCVPVKQPACGNGLPPRCVAHKSDDDEYEGEVCELFKSPAQLKRGSGGYGEAPSYYGSAPRNSKAPQPDDSGDRAVSVDGAVTTLHTLQQLRDVFHTPPATLDAEVQPTALKLRAGESVFVVLHNDKKVIEGMLRSTTRKLCACRIFCLDLATLPAAERIPPAGAAPSYILQSVASILQLDSLLNQATATDGHSASSAATPTMSETQGEPQNALDPAASWTDGDALTKLTLPSMVMWRAAGGPADEYNETSDVGATFGRAATASYGRPLVVKELQTVDQLHSLALLAPVYTVEHLLRKIGESAHFSSGCGGLTGTHTFIYMGASWCPPCMRILGAMPSMMEEHFPESFACVVKADMDLAMPLYNFFGVEIIPTFIILDNDVLREESEWPEFLQGGVENTAERLERLRDGLRRSELGRIQESNESLVRTFIDRHTKRLKFDEEF